VSRSIVTIADVVKTLTSKLRKSMNKPVKDFKNKGVSVALWEARNGGYSYSVQKRYKDKTTGEWKESRYWYKDELENLIELLKQAMAYAGDRTEHESQGSKSGPGHNVVRELTTEELDDLPW
jgi:hypothetical protein